MYFKELKHLPKPISNSCLDTLKKDFIFFSKYSIWGDKSLNEVDNENLFQVDQFTG